MPPKTGHRPVSRGAQPGAYVCAQLRELYAYVCATVPAPRHGWRQRVSRQQTFGHQGFAESQDPGRRSNKTEMEDDVRDYITVKPDNPRKHGRHGFRDRLHHLGDGLQVSLGEHDPRPPDRGPRPGGSSPATGGANEGLCPRLMSGECL